MKVDLKLNPCERVNHLEEFLIVIVDIFRATSVIVTLLSNGAECVLPVGKIERAFRLKEYLRENVILVGERNSVKIENFDFCNSPTELIKSKEKLVGRKIIMMTSNGTKAILNHSNALELIVASFLNVESSVDYALSKKHDVLLVCSGNDGRFSMEDFLFCGCFIHRLIRKMPKIKLSSSAYLAYKFYTDNINKLKEIVMISEHAKELVNLGFKEDIDFCLKEDIYKIIVKAKKIVLNDIEYIALIT